MGLHNYLAAEVRAMLWLLLCNESDEQVSPEERSFPTHVTWRLSVMKSIATESIAGGLLFYVAILLHGFGLSDLLVGQIVS
jgi:hypothetical protein